jgi:hypothetical protein
MKCRAGGPRSDYPEFLPSPPMTAAPASAAGASRHWPRSMPRRQRRWPGPRHDERPSASVIKAGEVVGRARRSARAAWREGQPSHWRKAASAPVGGSWSCIPPRRARSDAPCLTTTVGCTFQSRALRWNACPSLFSNRIVPASLQTKLSVKKVGPTRFQTAH